MKLTILGCYAATPRTFSNPTSQLLEIRGRHFLIDCAEGTQVQLRRNKIKFSKINHIFISHLHGDHFYGLIGFISSMTLLNREADLHVYGPKGIKEIILLQLKYADAYTGFGLYFHELSSKEAEVVYEDEKVVVRTVPLVHRIYTNGFLFREKIGERHLIPEKMKEYQISPAYFRNIKNGKDVVLADGSLIANSELTTEPIPPKSYAYCSDTRYSETLLDHIAHADVLYHESTFLQSEADLAERTMHSTAAQAATIASKAKVGTLILGHYSTRYGNIELFRQEAMAVFARVELADDGREFDF